MVLPAQIQDALTIFLGIIVQAVPFILLGVLVSAVLLHFVKQENLLKVIPRGKFFGLLAVCFLGFLFPVCECGNVPVARRLVDKGLPANLVVTFLLAAPALNPVVILSTWAAFRGSPEIVFWRMGLTLIVALLIGFWFSFNGRQEEMVAHVKKLEHDHLACTTRRFGKGANKFFAFFNTVVKEFFEMLKILVMGAVAAGLVQVLLPREMILALGHGPFWSVVAMMTFAFVISVCASVDAFIALAYSGIFTEGAIISFLVFGPMFDIKSMVMFRSVFKWRVVVLMLALSATLIGIASVLINIY